jgi:hypothetical protein
MYGLPITDHSELSDMTVEYAHLVMQAHINCPVTVCSVKRQARAVLIEAGHLVPDSSRAR